jgi:hypothetical protein
MYNIAFKNEMKTGDQPLGYNFQKKKKEEEEKNQTYNIRYVHTSYR